MYTSIVFFAVVSVIILGSAIWGPIVTALGVPYILAVTIVCGFADGVRALRAKGEDRTKLALQAAWWIMWIVVFTGAYRFPPIDQRVALEEYHAR